GPRADVGLVLAIAVVIAGDGAGANVCPRPDPRVANIGEMVGLGAVLDRRRLDLHEVADMHVGPELRTWAKSRERPDTRTFPYVRALDMRERADHRAVLDRDAGAEHDVGLDRDVLAEFGVGRQEHGLRRDH